MMTDWCCSRCMFRAQCVNRLKCAVSVQCLLNSRQNSEEKTGKQDAEFFPLYAHYTTPFILSKNTVQRVWG